MLDWSPANRKRELGLGRRPSSSLCKSLRGAMARIRFSRTATRGRRNGRPVVAEVSGVNALFPASRCSREPPLVDERFGEGDVCAGGGHPGVVGGVEVVAPAAVADCVVPQAALVQDPL